MKRILAIFLTLTFFLSVWAVAAEPGGDAATSAQEALYLAIREANPALTRDDGLQRIAVAYAQALSDAGEDFRRTTDFKTLPNGERVISLAASLGVPVSGFSYSVFIGRNARPETSNEFRRQVIDGGFTRVGVARLLDITVIVYDRTPVRGAVVAPTPAPMPTPAPIPALTPAQRYLHDTPEDDILAHFVKAVEIGTGANFEFASPADITSDDLFRFAVLFGDFESGMAWYSEDDELYYIPLADILGVLDTYLTGYELSPEDVSFGEYDADVRQFILTATGFGSGQSVFAVSEASAIGNDAVRVVLAQSFDGEYINDIEIIAMITETGPKFQSIRVVRDNEAPVHEQASPPANAVIAELFETAVKMLIRYHVSEPSLQLNRDFGDTIDIDYSGVYLEIDEIPFQRTDLPYRQAAGKFSELLTGDALAAFMSKFFRDVDGMLYVIAMGGMTGWGIDNVVVTYVDRSNGGYLFNAAFDMVEIDDFHNPLESRFSVIAVDGEYRISDIEYLLNTFNNKQTWDAASLYDLFRADQGFLALLESFTNVLDTPTTLFSDAMLAVYASHHLTRYDYENGNAPEEYNAIAEKHFSRRIEDFNNGMTEIIPGTGRVRGTGWSFNHGVYMVLDGDIVTNPDGTLAGIFKCYRISDGFWDDAAAELFTNRRENLLSGNDAGYPEPFTVMVTFEVRADEDGAYLFYHNVMADSLAFLNYPQKTVYAQACQAYRTYFAFGTDNVPWDESLPRRHDKQLCCFELAGGFCPITVLLLWVE